MGLIHTKSGEKKNRKLFIKNFNKATLRCYNATIGQFHQPTQCSAAEDSESEMLNEFQVEELGGLHGIAWSSMNSKQITDSDSLSPKRFLFLWMLVEDEDVKRHSTGTGRTYGFEVI